MANSTPLIANRFTLGQSIGRGATGWVYLGADTQTGEQVAIKLLRPDMVAEHPELVERFRREGEALRKLNHPNIVKVLATVEEEGQHYIVMEYVPGGSLADLIKRQPKLPIARIVPIALEVADALSRAHYLNVIHRDIKPANILLAADGTPRLTDFGLAHLGGLSAVTTVGEVLGTFQYLSPEACEGHALDERSDLWSFGVVLHEMLTGRRPFDGESPAEIVWAIQNQPLPELSWSRDDVPPSLANLVRRMLMRDRPVRIASARLVGAELEAIQRGSTGAAAGGKPAAGMAPQPEPVASTPSTPSTPPAPSAKIRVLIVDDHAVVRQGLRIFLELQDDIELAGEAANGLEAVEQARRLKPDIVLLDLVMPQLDGVAATPRIIEASPETRVIILTSFGEDSKVLPAIRAGAQGYLLKDIPPDDLVKAVREAYRGKTQLHPDVAKTLMSAIAAGQKPAEPPKPEPAPQSAKPGAGADALTEREIEVLRLIAKGLNNREIAERMVISEKTVKTHVSNILGKLRLEDRTQAAIYALKNGLAAGEP